MGWRTHTYALAITALSFVACGGSTSAQRADDGVARASVDEDNANVVSEPTANDTSTPNADGATAPEAADNAADKVVPDKQVIANPKVVASPATPTPTATPKAVADARFQTSRSRSEMSEFLVAPAATAMKKRKFALAVSLYRGLVAARGSGDPVAMDLARALRLGGDSDTALEVYKLLAVDAEDPAVRAEANKEAEIVRLAPPTAFGQRFTVAPATKQAVAAFKLGRKAFNKKKYADALLYFEMASALDPDMAGPVREIASAYDRLGARDKATAFDMAYLQRRPLGKLADEVRKRLRRNKMSQLLGTVSVVSKGGCQEIWVVGQLYRGRLPIKNLALAPGSYKWLCYHGDYQMAYFDWVKVEPGKAVTLDFKWAVVVNNVTNPYGRVAMEDYASPGRLVDLGLEVREFGVPVPSDGRQLEVRIRALDGSREQTQFVKLTSGERVEIKWK